MSTNCCHRIWLGFSASALTSIYSFSTALASSMTVSFHVILGTLFRVTFKEGKSCCRYRYTKFESKGQWFQFLHTKITEPKDQNDGVNGC